MAYNNSKGSNNNFQSIVTSDGIKVPLETLEAKRKASFFIGDNDVLTTKVLCQWHITLLCSIDLSQFFVNTDFRKQIIGPDDEEIPSDEILVPPDGGWGWMIVLASFLSNMIVDGIVFSFGILLTPIHEASKGTIPISSIAWVGSLATGFYFLAGN
jgi:hypothetical protein